jgi:hypothetical protein
MTIDRTSNTEIVGFLEVGDRSIILTGYKDAPKQRSIEPQTLKLLDFKAQPNQPPSINRTQANRSIISTRYKDTPQQRSIEPQTLGLLGFEGFYPIYGATYWVVLFTRSIL